VTEEPKIPLSFTIHQLGGLKATIAGKIRDVDRLDTTGAHAECRQQLVDVQTEIERAWSTFQSTPSP